MFGNKSEKKAKSSSDAAGTLVSDDPRMGTLIQPIASYKQRAGVRTRVAIVGFPYDEGCVRNGGRYGAGNGPSVFRRVRALSRLCLVRVSDARVQFAKVLGTVGNPEFPSADFSRVDVVDAGDVPQGKPWPAKGLVLPWFQAAYVAHDYFSVG